ncbi:hypothetical protein RHMOL_Rhmol04G0282800 [Rhododendron molle]|uniref:Uncharacterized protein n=2 Tax=Rhododendron molle TaxID=49168 RepID=A0ACC0P6X2_RHOML|nr:hypothetical protein RHMOL_Rhmol04G0282800 [Rhododendron molle]KAI8560784.1 hypothetical protein RHMOL_Rhmol04G0282800 [Rhododendron molle]
MGMGCFLACFGFSKKRKRRKPANKLISLDQGHGSYKPLDSDVNRKLDITENHSKADSEFGNKGKERTSSRIRKKVSFNSIVKTYEPLPNHDFTSYFSESDEEKDEKGKSNIDSFTSKNSCYPSNYRYYNCRESFEDEENIEVDESDPDNDHEESIASSDDGKVIEEEFSEQFCSLSMRSAKRVNSTNKKAEDFLPLSHSLDQELKKCGLNPNAQRRRSDYVFSVLNPVENLTQWKAVKATAKQALKQQRKENIALEQGQQMPMCRKESDFNHKPKTNHSKPLMQDFAVDASLSNWLHNSSS